MRYEFANLSATSGLIIADTLQEALVKLKNYCPDAIVLYEQGTKKNLLPSGDEGMNKIRQMWISGFKQENSILLNLSKESLDDLIF